MRSPNFTRVSMLLFAAAQLSQAHTWIEEMLLIGQNGTMVGTPGYARGNVVRGTPGVNLDGSMVHLLPPNGDRALNDIRSSDLMCMASQTSQTQTNGSPRLQAPAGAAIALRYQENGHVTLPDTQAGKPSNRGTNYVYGTSQPSSDDALLAIHRQWTPDGKGGDGRGVLLSTQNYDDGQCYQVNGGSISQQRQAQFKHTAAPPQAADLWCQQDIAIPSTLKAGDVYTLYWVWDWPTMPGTAGFPQGKQELYTTCMDIDIVDNSLVEPISKGAQFASGQDYVSAAASAQFADIANPTAVTNPQTIAFSASATGPASGTSPTASSPSTASSAPATSKAPQASSTVPTSSPPPANTSSGQAASQSASPTTTDDSFLSVHTQSTAGPGLETASFTVIPIGVSAPSAPTNTASPSAAPPATTAQPNPESSSGGQGDGQGGPGGRGGSGAGNGSGMANFFSANFTGSPPFPIPSGSGWPTSFPHPSGTYPSGSMAPSDAPIGQFGDGTATNVQANVPMSTFTQYDTATEFITQTIWQTMTDAAAVATQTPAVKARAVPTCSQQHQAFRLRARMPFVKNFFDKTDGSDC